MSSKAKAKKPVKEPGLRMPKDLGKALMRAMDRSDHAREVEKMHGWRTPESFVE